MNSVLFEDAAEDIREALNSFLDRGSDLISWSIALAPAPKDHTPDRYAVYHDRHRLSPPLVFCADTDAFYDAFEATLKQILAEAQKFFTEHVFGGGVDLEWIPDPHDSSSGHFLYFFYYYDLPARQQLLNPNLR